MDTVIVRQVGDHLILGLSQQSLVQVALALLLFLMGYYANKRLEIWKLNRRLKDLREFFLNQCTSILAPIDLHFKSLNDAADNLADETHPDGGVEQIAALYLEPIRSLSTIDLFTAFRQGPRKTKLIRLALIRDVLTAIEFIRLQQERVPIWLSKFDDAFRRYQDRWNRSTDALLRKHDEYTIYARKLKIPPSRDPFLRDINAAVHNWTLIQDSTTYPMVQKHLLDPILAICKLYNDDERVTVILPFVLEASAAHRSIQGVSKTYSSLFRVQAQRLMKRKADLTSAIDTLRAH
jgi:hypothetical protein